MSLPTYKVAGALTIVAGLVTSLVVGLAPASAAVPQLEASYSTAVQGNPDPSGSVTFAQPTCKVDKVVVNITDTTGPGVGPGYAGIFYWLVSNRGTESQTSSPGNSLDSVDRLSSFTLSSKALALGETVNFTVKARLDTSVGSPQVVVIRSFTATRPNDCALPAANTAPGAPRGVRATPGNALAVVSWTAPASNGGSPTTGYTVTASPGGKIVTTTGATTATMTGLSNGTAFTFTVTATNKIGISPRSAPSNAVTPSAPSADPAAIVPLGSSRSACAATRNRYPAPRRRLTWRRRRRPVTPHRHRRRQCPRHRPRRWPARCRSRCGYRP